MMINREMAEKNEIENLFEEIENLKNKPPQLPKNKPVPRIAANELLIELEEKTKKLMNALEDWREIILLIRSIALWEKKYYFWAIIGGSSLFFLCLWLLDPSVLTTLSLMGLTITISDYVVPLLTRIIFKAESWTDENQKIYYNFCNSAVLFKEKLLVRFALSCMWRTNRPITFYGITICTLMLWAWVGNIMNNLLLTYLLVTVLLLLPGMDHSGFLGKVDAVTKFIETEYLRIDRSRVESIKKDE